jgi:hypothetical protein
LQPWEGARIIAAPDARRYLSIVVAVLCCVVVLPAACVGLVLQTGLIQLPEDRLFQYQLQKIKTASPDIDTIFVGDSSLGNSVDADLFSSISGRASLNLALTGGYGYAGTLNMIRHALVYFRPRNVVIVQTIDLPTRKVYWMGYHATLPRLIDLPLAETAKAVHDYSLFLFQPRTLLSVVEQARKPSRAAPEIVNDYIAQRPQRREVAPDARVRTRIDPEQTGFLDDIVSICREQGMNCVYAYGPIRDVYCRNSADFISRETAEIERAGLPVVPNTPFCLPRDDQGDAEDHVVPPAKSEYTRRYFETLAPYLR